LSKACEHAFAVGRKFFDAYDAEADATKAIPDGKTKAEPKKVVSAAPRNRSPRSGPSRRQPKPDWFNRGRDQSAPATNPGHNR
jgi:hypothetical protein